MSTMSKVTKKNSSKKIRTHNRKVIEALEPRLLLSGDDLLPNFGGTNGCY